MTAPEENKLSSMYAVKAFRATYGPEVELETTALTEIFDNFEAILASAEDHEGEATLNRSGYALDKKTKRKKLEFETNQIASASIAYYKKIKDYIAAFWRKFTKTMLHEMRDAELSTWTMKLADKITPYNPATEAYGTTLAEHGTYVATVNTFKDVLGHVEVQRQIAVAAGIEFEKDLVKMEDECLLADPIMENYIESKSIIYNVWQGVRKTVDNAAGQTPPTGEVLVPAGGYLAVPVGTYSAIRYFKVSNTGTEAIAFGLSTNQAAFSGTFRALGGGDKSMVLSSTLGSEGEYLLFHNPDDEPVTIVYWVVNQ